MTMNIHVYGLQSGIQTGVYNMALDDALLEYARAATDALFIVRTYRWSEPTYSLGAHQPVKDVATLPTDSARAFTKRPTGGRAILHGKDVSFSFITNEPTLLKKPLKDSYCVLMSLVKAALDANQVAYVTSCERNDSAYTRSAICFETQTSSDLTTPLRRKNRRLRPSPSLRRHSSTRRRLHRRPGK